MEDTSTDTNAETNIEENGDGDSDAHPNAITDTAVREIEGTDDDERAIDANGAAEHHGARAALYAALASVFCYPDKATVRELTATDTETGLREAAATLGYDEAVERLLAALSDTDAATLESAYNGLFGLPDGDGYPVVPYEAEHTIHGDIGQKQRRIATVAGLLSALDLEVATDFHERPDHVAVELEIMQVLCARRAVAIRENDRGADDLERAAATVLDEHLVDFIPSLIRDLQAASDHPVYAAAADLTGQFVADDAAAHPDSISTDDRARMPGGGELQ